jgi:hypothetical protein
VPGLHRAGKQFTAPGSVRPIHRVGRSRGGTGRITPGAAYYKSAGDNALFAGEIGAAAGIAKGLAGLGSGSGKAPGGSSMGDPTQIGSLY